ncbi:TonB-dependent receptor [Halieaceae bacterium IMCC14734]|uniref:TonB-dependent receptor n=1 Tax=Candidatus Litorirhabdus singularis TaxID=2518993 RepID=A0ABT3TF55_9GAMM|nr:TonB-dependent receptor [Candidatus Litorirhabdus singularis]MCX2980450.1 TonB-dependent receptor [Candidatus Litorirhabdus singularis]
MKNRNTHGIVHSPRKALALACSAAIASTFISLPALTQEGAVTLEEVIVTARKRDESLQDVAVSVSAIGAELNQATVRRLEDIQTYSPNLYIRREAGGGSAATISIRGVGTLDTDKSLDPAIGVMMDGVFLGTASGVLMQNFDIKRVEVLRGPQGTLFGKNTTGGLINIIRGDVTKEWGGDFSVALDEFGREDIKGVVNVPIIEEKLGVKLFGAQIKHDGYVKNTTLNRDVGGDDVKNYGFAAEWQATDAFDIKFHYEKTMDESDQGAYVNENQPGDFSCSIYGDCASTTTDNKDQNSANGTNFSDNEYDTYILTANYDFDSMLLTYIGSKRDMDEQNMQHFDAGPADMLEMNFFNIWEQESHELRLTSQLDGPFQFVAGLYMFDVDYEQRWDVAHLHYTLVPGLTPTTLSSNGQSQQTESIAAFISADWDITEKFTLTVGGRYTEEEKDFVGGNGGVFYDPAAGDPIPALFEPVNYDDKWEEFTPSVSGRYQINDDHMVWASYAEGFKSGGFFGRQANFDLDASFEPEYVDNYELGLKSTFMDGAMTFNSTIFFSDYQDKQESILIPVDSTNVATVVRNASTEEIFGLEFDLNYQITANWFMRANYGYLDASYDEYLADINGDQMITDNSDLTPRNTPENTFGLSTSYTMEVGPGNLSGVLAYRYRDEIEAEASNNPLGTMDAIDDVSAQLSYSFSEDRFRITAYGKNLTDEREKRVQLITPISTRGYWNEPRTYGVEFAASF